ncbi:MAG: hypothetical protein JW904_07685 [Spirochaetales bacterium]|nr:hypothetical protein [Spirochaetales bacterium]
MSNAVIPVVHNLKASTARWITGKRYFPHEAAYCSSYTASKQAKRS